MSRSRPMAEPSHTAATVRHRLLCDRIMRHNRDTAVLPRLSPAEQYRQAMQIARCFKHHYLAEITCSDDHLMTVAVVRPVVPRHPTYEIWIDIIGNVSVQHRHMYSKRLSRLHQVIFVFGILFAGIVFLTTFT
jgi:hypothetical protein